MPESPPTQGRREKWAIPEADAKRVVRGAERDAWLEPIVGLVRVQHSERLAITAACLALAGDSYEESRERLDHCIDVIAEGLEVWRKERGRNQKPTQKEQIAARAL